MFYDQVESLCKSRGIAISTLARNLHLSPSAPNNWNEGTLPKAETIMKLSEFFDHPPSPEPGRPEDNNPQLPG